MITIRELTPLDYNQIIKLDQSIFGNDAYNVSELKDILSHSRSISFGVWDDKQLVGYVLALINQDNVCQIEVIAVEKRSRGKHYAMQLHQNVCNAAKDLGCNQIQAKIDVANFPLYETMSLAGYQELKELPGYFPANQTALVMQCQL